MDVDVDVDDTGADDIAFLRTQARGPPEQSEPPTRTLSHGQLVTQIRDSRHRCWVYLDGSDLRAHQAPPHPNPQPRIDS